MYRKLGLSN